MSFLDLPNDILKEFMHNYLYPPEALKCLQVCKLLNRISDRDIIIKRCIYHNNQIRMMKELDTMIFCPQCNIRLTDQKRLNTHLQKHAHKKKLGKTMMATKDTLHIYDCTKCGLPESNFTSHKCCYTTRCYNRQMSGIFPWAESLCQKDEWYIFDPKFKLHHCKSRCKLCKEEFNSGVIETDIDFNTNGFYPHYQTCPLQSEMIRIYNLQGNRTDEECFAICEQWDAKSKSKFNEDEIKFEQEYLEWKKSL